MLKPIFTDSLAIRYQPGVILFRPLKDGDPQRHPRDSEQEIIAQKVKKALKGPFGEGSLIANPGIWRHYQALLEWGLTPEGLLLNYYIHYGIAATYLQVCVQTPVIGLRKPVHVKPPPAEHLHMALQWLLPNDTEQHFVGCHVVAGAWLLCSKGHNALLQPAV